MDAHKVRVGDTGLLVSSDTFAIMWQIEKLEKAIENMSRDIERLLEVLKSEKVSPKTASDPLKTLEKIKSGKK